MSCSFPAGRIWKDILSAGVKVKADNWQQITLNLNNKAVTVSEQRTDLNYYNTTI